MDFPWELWSSADRWQRRSQTAQRTLPPLAAAQQLVQQVLALRSSCLSLPVCLASHVALQLLLSSALITKTI